MSKSHIIHRQFHSTIKASVVIGLVILAAYAPVIFLGQTFQQTNPLVQKFEGINGKHFLFQTALDPAGVSQLLPPILNLARTQVLEGKVPLWNPYQGAGDTLAANTENWVFSPTFLLYLLPLHLWDFALYFSLWIAGMFTYLFLRQLGLNFPSSIIGGIFYMLSGMFTFYLPHTVVAVIIFTPMILYSLEKIIQNKNPKYISLVSVSFAFSLLGAHEEAVILQYLLVGLYFSYRILTIAYHKRKNNYQQFLDPFLIQAHSIRRIILCTLLGYVGAVGLSSFFIFPVHEYLKNGALSHFPFQDWNTYVEYPLSFSINFIPMLHGELQSFWSLAIAGAGGWHAWGVLGVTVLFFSLLGVYTSIKNKNFSLHRYTPILMLSIGAFFILVSCGVPVASWIGNLPLFDLIAWWRYSGVIIPLSFIIPASFGIHFLSESYVKKKTIAIISLITIAIVLLVALPVLQYLYPSNPLASAQYLNKGAVNFVLTQLLQALLIVACITTISIAASKNKSAIIGIGILVLLELSLYIPMGLDARGMFYKSIVVLSGSAIITGLFLLPNLIKFDLNNLNNVKFWLIIGLSVLIIGGEIMVSYQSPVSMPKSRNMYESNPVIDFLKSNGDYYRIYSLDTFAANFPSGYEISTTGESGAFMLNNFFNFKNYFLDPQQYNLQIIDTSTNLDYPPWTYLYGPATSLDKLTNSSKYYQFLGTKYYLTSGYDLNSISPGPPSTYNYTKIGLKDGYIVQSFISPIDAVKSIGISFGTYGLHNRGNVILTVDSIPYHEQYHREAIMNAERINSTEYNSFVFDQPLTHIMNTTLQLSLKYPDTKDDAQKLAVYLQPNTSIGYDPTRSPLSWDNSVDFSVGYIYTTEKLHGKFYLNGTFLKDRQLSFALTPLKEKFIQVFKYNSVNVFEDPDVYPRVFFVNKFVITQTNKSQNYLLAHPDFDLRHNVVLEESLPLDVIDSINLPPSIHEDANITLYSADRAQIHTHNDNSALLVFTDTYYPGWKAFVDGKETKVYLADGLVRAIFVPSGNHIVEFSYKSDSFAHGLEISLATTVLLIGVIVFSKRIEKITLFNK